MKYFNNDNIIHNIASKTLTNLILTFSVLLQIQMKRDEEKDEKQQKKCSIFSFVIIIILNLINKY